MSRIIKRTSKKIGLHPGALVHVGDQKIDKPIIELVRYNENEFEEKRLQSMEEFISSRAENKNTWLNIDGLHDVGVIETIGKQFNIHPLVLEDILNTEKRPLIEDYGDYIYMVAKMLSYDDEENIVKAEQVSVVLGNNYVVTFQESVGDVFNSVRERLRQGKGRIRKDGPDYLAYSLVDCIVDNYFIILEKFSESIEDIEEVLMNDFDQDIVEKIYRMKREMVLLRKSVWPLREVVIGLERFESTLINKSTIIYIRDLYDHTFQVIDTVETLSEMLSGILEIYLFSLSNKMNQVMKVLTIMASIFIPLTFIASIYGMNFEFMPELQSKYGYPIVLAFMISIVIFMIVLFKKKKWI
ncbi:MAG: magnesium/cobalt transporter CorA [Thermodesulfobacteriota bacterium]